jgi:three-Cys-motif partner protein
MTAHRFGGAWTQDKLRRLEKYLKAHRTIFTRNPKAQYFKSWYVDAFAGTGARVSSVRSREELGGSTDLFGDVYADQETLEYQDGSARIALSLPEPFDNYVFIDKAARHLAELQRMIKNDFTQLVSRCTFEPGDANEVLRAWCKQRDWTKERAVVFLDPYGMQVEWSTIEALAATKGIDLWYLFPLGIGVARLLTRSGQIEEAWQKRLDLLFGTREWRRKFYDVHAERNLFGEERETLWRTAGAERIETFIHERLASVFVKVAKGKVLKNSRQSPLYLLCFAASNERGAAPALKIAQDILRD